MRTQKEKQENVLRLELKAPKTTVPATVVSALTIERIIDMPGQKIVRAFARELPSPVVLWQGDAYDKIGNWTQDQANARILELLDDWQI